MLYSLQGLPRILTHNLQKMPRFFFFRGGPLLLNMVLKEAYSLFLFLPTFLRPCSFSLYLSPDSQKVTLPRQSSALILLEPKNPVIILFVTELNLRVGVSKPQPWAKSCLLSSFESSILFAHSHTCLFMYCDCFSATRTELSSCDRRYGPQSLKHFLSSSYLVTPGLQ